MPSRCTENCSCADIGSAPCFRLWARSGHCVQAALGHPRPWWGAAHSPSSQLRAAWGPQGACVTFSLPDSCSGFSVQSNFLSFCKWRVLFPASPPHLPQSRDASCLPPPLPLPPDVLACLPGLPLSGLWSGVRRPWGPTCSLSWCLSLPAPRPVNGRGWRG